jgi:hypothetical protein
MKTRQEVCLAIEEKISNSILSEEQKGHLRSELTINRILQGRDTIEQSIIETNDLSRWGSAGKLLISAGWTPIDLVNARYDAGYMIYFLDFFKKGLFTPYAMPKMTAMYDINPDEIKFIDWLANDDFYKQECFKLLTLTPLTDINLIELGCTTAKVVVKKADKIIFLMKHNILTLEDLKSIDQEGRKNPPRPGAILPGTGYSWYVDIGIEKKYRPIMQARSFTGLAARVLSQGSRSKSSVFFMLPTELNHQILMFIDPIGDRQANCLILDRFARPAPIGFFAGIGRFITDAVQQVEDSVSEFFLKQ